MYNLYYLIHNNHCKSKEIIDKYFDRNTFIVVFEDILINPLNYETPIKEQINSLYTYVYKYFGQYMFVEMQLVNIETSTNIIGFDFLTKPKIDEFIKYYSLEILPEPGYDLDDEKNDYPVCEVEFTLNDKILVEKRQYIQLVDILGEVGGLMEFLFSFFRLICNIIGDLLYEKTIVNNLFSFDIRKKLIFIKKRNNSIHNVIIDKNKEKHNSNNKIDLSFIPDNTKKVKNKLILNKINMEEINSKRSENSLTKKKIISENQSYKNDIEILKNTKELHIIDFGNSNEIKKPSGFLKSKRNNFLSNNKNIWIIDIVFFF